MDSNEYTLDSDYFKEVAKGTATILAIAAVGAVTIVATTEKFKEIKRNRKAKKTTKN